MTMDPTVSNPPAPFTPTAATVVAYEKCKAEIAEAARGPLEALNVDIPFAVRVMLTACGNATPYREALAKLNLDVVPTLETRAMALQYAQVLRQWTLETPTRVEDLAKDLIETRRLLTSELELVRLRGIISAKAVTLTGTTGYLDVAQDVQAICSAFLAAWDKVGPEIGGRIERVNERLVQAEQLIAAVAHAAEIKEKLEGATLMRVAAWTLALKSYRDLDRGISFLRYHEGDAGEIVPSLFDNRARSHKAAPEPTPIAPVPAPPATNAATPAVGGTPAASVPMAPSKPFDE